MSGVRRATAEHMRRSVDTSAHVTSAIEIDMSRIVATLERFNYKVIGRYQETKPVENERERIDMLLRYLDI